MTDRPGRRSRAAGTPQRRAGSVPSAGAPESETPEVEVRRSRRRRRTVSAYRDGDRVVVLLPARMTRAEEREWVTVMLERLAAQERRRRPSDATLLERAGALRRRYLHELDDDAAPTSVRWVTNQGRRWGSCTPADRTVRLSTRLQGMPRWVIDYVLLHELTHLVEPGHTERFWAIVGRYPRTERARGYLEGVAAAADLPLSELADAEDEPSDADHATDADTGAGPDSDVDDEDTPNGPGNGTGNGEDDADVSEAAAEPDHGFEPGTDDDATPTGKRGTGTGKRGRGGPPHVSAELPLFE